MGFPGTWMTTDGHTVYRVVPKCACSTIGQLLFYGSNGEYFDGDIHDADHGLIKWNMEAEQDRITSTVTGGEAFTFTCVRNPYTRILSAFFDKIAGIQRNGNRYRGNLVPMLTNKYGVDVEGDFDQIAAFRRFLLFARDTIRFRKPMDPDIHWSAVSGHVSTLIANGGRYDLIFPTELFGEGMRQVIEAGAFPHAINLDDVPRFNESSGHGPKRAHPVEDYFDDLCQHLMLEMYHRDFELFRYAREPNDGPPTSDFDLAEIHAKLGE